MGWVPEDWCPHEKTRMSWLPPSVRACRGQAAPPDLVVLTVGHMEVLSNTGCVTPRNMPARELSLPLRLANAYSYSCGAMRTECLRS